MHHINGPRESEMPFVVFWHLAIRPILISFYFSVKNHAEKWAELWMSTSVILTQETRTPFIIKQLDWGTIHQPDNLPTSSVQLNDFWHI